jgi:hypothetical protein
MITNFDKPASVPTSEPGMWSARTQYHEATRTSLVERVCRFLEQYPFLHANDEDVAPSATLGRTGMVMDGGKPRHCFPNTRPA